METLAFIDSLARSLERQMTQAEALRSEPLEHLQQRPDPKRWSVLEIIEHMNLSSVVYYHGLRDLYAKPVSKLRFSSTYTPGRLGAFSAKAMQPGTDGAISWRMKTMGMFEPRTATTKGWTALDEFQAILRGMLQLLSEGKVKGIEGEKITSTLGPILRFKAGDAFAFPIAHQERHWLQIERTLKAVAEMDKVGTNRQKEGQPML